MRRHLLPAKFAVNDAGTGGGLPERHQQLARSRDGEEVAQPFQIRQAQDLSPVFCRAAADRVGHAGPANPPAAPSPPA